MSDFKAPLQVVRSMPDNESQEAVIYGSAYTKIKTDLWTIDHVIDIIEERKAGILAEIDVVAADIVCKEYNDLTMTEDPLDECSDKLLVKTIMSLREFNRLGWSQKWFEDLRERIQLGARLIGSTEHSILISRSGYNEDLWRSAALRWSQKPMEYSSLKVKS